PLTRPITRCLAPVGPISIDPASHRLHGVESGLVFFSFPLRQPGRPDTRRGEHLAAVTVPMLFLSGTRDEFAAMDLILPVCERLGDRATLHAVDTADHGYKVLKRSRARKEDVFVEMARAVREWASALE